MNLSLIPLWAKISLIGVAFAAVYGVGYGMGHNKQAALVELKTKQIIVLETSLKESREAEKAKDQAIVTLNDDKQSLVAALNEQNNNILAINREAHKRQQEADRQLLMMKRKHATTNAHLKNLVEVQSQPIEGDSTSLPELLQELQTCRRAVAINRRAEEAWQ